MSAENLVEFVRFEASDGVQLAGWLSDVPGDTAILHIHGREGNGYENRFIDFMRESAHKNGISFLSIDTRGRGVVSSFRKLVGDGSEIDFQGGAAYELFEECVYDIEGAVRVLAERGKTKIILQGHSIGASKVVHYALRGSPSKQAQITAFVLLAPTNMITWAESHTTHPEFLSRAKELLAAGKKAEFVASHCWLDDTPISAQTYPTISERGSAVDIFSPDDDGHTQISRIKQPMILAMGSEDVGVRQTVGTIEQWQTGITPLLNSRAKIATITGAPHGFRGYESQLTTVITQFLAEL